ncbi:MAG TPA: biopolymer transporter ExbD [Tepidisphaeraceae bacterium]|jgi:biopolymer transport protein ExbD
MKRRSMPDMKEGGVNVTPLIDIVMVLIIFFMLVAKIGVSRGEDESVPLPSAILGVSLDSLSNTLTLNIHYNRSGEEPLVNALVKGEKREIHVTKRYASGTDLELDRVLAEFHDINKEKTNIILHADKDLPYAQLEPVLTSIAKAGIMNVSYETLKGADQPAQAGGATAMAQ